MVLSVCHLPAVRCESGGVSMKELVSSRPGWEPSVGSAGSGLCAEAAGLDLKDTCTLEQRNGSSSCLFWSALKGWTSLQGAASGDMGLGTKQGVLMEPTVNTFRITTFH